MRPLESEFRKAQENLARATASQDQQAIQRAEKQLLSAQAAYNELQANLSDQRKLQERLDAWDQVERIVFAIFDARFSQCEIVNTHRHCCVIAVLGKKVFAVIVRRQEPFIRIANDCPFVALVEKLCTKNFGVLFYRKVRWEPVVIALP